MLVFVVVLVRVQCELMRNHLGEEKCVNKS